MNGKRYRGSRGLWTLGVAGAILLLTGLTGGVRAQGTRGGGDLPFHVPPAPASNLAPASDGILPAGCSSCGGGVLGSLPPDIGMGGGCATCGGGGCNGRRPCDCCCDGENCLARLFCGFYQCVCCPDPCYEPRWNALADAAFFTEAPRPITQIRLRYEHVWGYPFPDKAEYLFARADGNGKGPKPLPGTLGGGSLDYQDFMYYQEVGIDRFSASVEMPYTHFAPDNYAGVSGFGDLAIGTKTLLLDCELMQFAFGLKTFVPTGNFTKGLGTGHVSLEPSAMLALRLAPETYLQAQLAYRIPIGGDAVYQGPVLHYHLSLNQLLWHCGNDIKLIGVAELNGYEITGGAFTDTVTGLPRSAKQVGDIANIGPGIRLVICDKIDFGIGSAFNFTTSSMGDEWLRVEFRWRF
jgi:hypothetical protein